MLNPEDAEDIFQLTCLEAWRSQTRFNGQASLSTWMCGIAQNLIRNHFRRLYARPVHCEFDEMLCHEQDCSRDLYGQFETHRRLERTLVALNRLPSEMRDTLYASVHSGGSYLRHRQRSGNPHRNSSLTHLASARTAEAGDPLLVPATDAQKAP